jgi:hypothetical protein
MAAINRRAGNAQSRAETGDEIIALRVVDNTRGQYSSTINRVTGYLSQHHPSTIRIDKIRVDEEWKEILVILLPLSDDVWKEILVYHSIKRNHRTGEEHEPRKYNQFSTIASIISALKFLYEERQITIRDETYKMLSGMQNTNISCVTISLLLSQSRLWKGLQTKDSRPQSNW